MCKRRYVALRHKLIVKSLSPIGCFTLVNEYPKSGGTWLAQMLAEALDIPFRFGEQVRIEHSVTHGHFLSPLGLRNVVVLWRDPRDLLVSFYFHCYFVNEHNNVALVNLMKKRCPFSDYSDIRSNLPAFIRFLSITPISPSFTWPDFAAVWARRTDIVQTSYEALRADTPTELSRVVGALTGRELSGGRAAEVAERYSFARAKRAAERNQTAHAEVSFIREGAIGGWRKHFSPDADDAIREGGYCEAMRTLNYMAEKTHSPH